MINWWMVGIFDEGVDVNVLFIIVVICEWVVDG